MVLTPISKEKENFQSLKMGYFWEIQQSIQVEQVLIAKAVHLVQIHIIVTNLFSRKLKTRAQ